MAKGKGKQKSATPAAPPARGPLADREGRVLVDPVRFPTLHRAVDRAMAPRRVQRQAWADVAAAKRAGREGEAGVLLAEIFGTAPPVRAATSTVPAGLGVEELLKRLAARPPKSEASRIRAELRRLGHKGGLKSSN